MICSNCHKEIGDAAFCPHCGASVLKASLLHHLPVGTLIGGRYRVEGVLGEGGFGITYLTRDNKLGHAVAVKEYYPRGFSYRSNTGTNEVYVSSQEDAAFYEHGKERFLSEAKTLARFSEEPGVVSVTDYIEENNTVYLVMEYLRGVTLQQYLKQHGNLSADAAFSMLEPVMKTLEKIHAAGVIHRDISPDNIMVLQNGQLKLMDFGAAKEFVDDNRSMSVMLKKGYAPIEQYRRNGKQGPWTDVYALCATIYRCITGKTPKDSLDRIVEDTLKKPSDLGAAISPAQERALMRGLAVRQEDRCQNMTELLRLFEQARCEKEENRNSSSRPKTIGHVGKESDPTEIADVPGKDPNATMVAGKNATDPNATVMADRPVVNQRSVPPVRTEPVQNSAQNTFPKKDKKAVVIGAVAAVLVLAIAIGIIFIKPWLSKSAETNSEIAAEETENTIDRNWSNIVAVSAGEQHTVGLKQDGTVVATGDNEYGQCDVGDWTNITAITAGEWHTVGLKKDGTVVVVGNNESGQCNVGSWTDIVAVSAGFWHTVGLQNDGTVVTTKVKHLYNFGQCDVGDWMNIVAISVGAYHSIGLTKDGTVVATGDNEYGQCDVGDWTDIVAVTAGDYYSVGLKKDGTVVATGENESGQCKVDDWTDIVEVAAGGYHTLGLKQDGTVVATGENVAGQCDIGGWTDIVAVSAGGQHTVGLKQDGTVVATGRNSLGQCNVSD